MANIPAGPRGMARAFFDVPEVMSQMDKATQRSLAKAGGLIRRHARSYKLRRKKGVSLPGSSPHIHAPSGFASLKNILFSWDAKTRSVVVGPVYFSTTLGQPVPELLEYGSRGSDQYRARPFMRPAFEELQKKGMISKQFKESIGRG